MTDLDSMSLVEAALWYASRGIPVFPCRPRGKEPMIAGGFHAATTDRDTIRDWWSRWPQANIGVPTGAVSGWLVVDVDVRNNGTHTLDAWLAKFGRWPDTAEAITGGGGRHIIFRHTPGLRCGPIGEGIDLKVDAGYIIVAPSTHPSGARYRWDGIDGAEPLSRLAEPPGWLLRIAREHRARTAASSAPGTKIPAGRRNTELTSIAGVLRSRGAGEAELRDLLAHVNRALCDPPLSEDEIERIAASIARYEPRKEGERADMQRIFARIDEGHYRMTLPGIVSELEVDLLRREDAHVVGDLTVRCLLPGNRGVDGIISFAEFNLSSARARVERAKILAARANTKAEEVDWIGILEDFCQRVLLAEREGEPAVDLADATEKDTDISHIVDGFPLLQHHATILFGDGGACKSYLALYFAWRLAERGETVLYADWELDIDAHTKRLRRLAGTRPRGIKYLRCKLPISHEAERLRRAAREHNATYLICDSVALGCDAPPETSESAMRYFQALRRIGLGSLLIAHVIKSEHGDKKPFGSVFWHNSARATWYIERNEQIYTENVVHVGLFQKKANLDGMHRPAAFRLEFTPDRTTVRRADAADIGEFAERMTLAQRVAHLLRAGAMSLTELAGRLDVPESTIRTILSRKPGVFTRLPDGRIGLITQDE